MKRSLLGEGLKDGLYALRQIKGSLGFTIATVLTLALGLGATTAVFELYQALVLNPLSLPDADRLVYVRQVSRSVCPRCADMPVGNFLRLRNLSSEMTLEAVREWRPALRGEERTDVIIAAKVTPGFHRTLGAAVILGRPLFAQDSVAGAPAVTVISERTWRHRFGADPDILGKSTVLDGAMYTIVGVVLGAHVFPPQTEIWTTLQFDPSDLDAHSPRHGSRVQVFGRLRTGRSRREASSEVRAIRDQLATQFPEHLEGWTITADPIQAWRAEFRPALFVVMAGVAVLLAIACVNLSALFLARLVFRRRELSVRAALGASRGRLARQLTAEAIVLCLLSIGPGWLLASWIIYGVKKGMPPELTSFLAGWSRIGLDWGAMSFCLSAAVGIGLVLGLGSALQLGGSAEVLGDGKSLGTESAQGRRIRRPLIVIEVAASVVLLSVGALLLQTMVNMARADPGVQARNVLTMSLHLPASGESELRSSVFQELAEIVEGLPTVDAAGFVTALPLTRRYNTVAFQVGTEGGQQLQDWSVARLQLVTPGYFRALGIQLLQGRMFRSDDMAGHRTVALINQEFARRYFRDGDAIGRVVSLGGAERTIVGVVGDVAHNGVNDEVGVEIYILPGAAGVRQMDLAVRVVDDPERSISSILRALRGFEPDMPVTQVRSMEQVVDDFLAPYRLLLFLMIVFAFLALLLSAIGLFGVANYAAVRRRSEFGIRLAIGASGSRLWVLVVWEGLKLALAGTLIGIGMSLAAGRTIRFILFEVTPMDWGIIASVSGLVLVVTVLAALLPARRAAGIDPLRSLRAE